MNRQRIRLWDLPTRLFHWLLVILVLTSFISGKIGGNAMDWHGKFGLAILGLLTFRLVWGIVGSTYARFASFFPTPASVLAYLRGQWRGVGHNPLGALSVFSLLGLLAFQVASGLFGNDDRAPSPEQVNQHEAELKKHGKSHEFHRYDGAGHGFFYWHRPLYRPEQAMDGWGRVLAFFGKHLAK